MPACGSASPGRWAGAPRTSPKRTVASASVWWNSCCCRSRWGGASRAPLQTWDETRRVATLELRGVQLQALDRIDVAADTHEALQRTSALAALLLAAEQLGGAQQCLDLTLAYVAERTQFGQPI